MCQESVSDYSVELTHQQHTFKGDVIDNRFTSKKGKKNKRKMLKAARVLIETMSANKLICKS